MGLIFEKLSIELLAVLAIVIVAGYYYVQNAFNYWKNRGIKSFPASFPFGNFAPAFLQKQSFSDVVEKFYNKTTEPCFGAYTMFSPMLVVRDPEIIRAILIKDFQYFADRNVYIDEKKDPLSGHLFSLNGDKWRNMRTKLTPVFTSGKLKAMFTTMVDCGMPLVNYMDKAVDKREIIEAREISARFATDVIASVAFGVSINTMDNPDDPFRAAGRKAFALNIKNGLRLFGLLIFPKIYELLRFKAVDDDVEKFIMDLVKQTLEYREEKNVTRKDFFQLLIQLRNSGQIQKDGEWDTKIKDKESKQLTINEMAAQTWVFYAAGFETSSTTMSYCLYELARNPDIQRKVQQEIDEITKKYNGQITYQSAADMKYLEACIDETLRKYPPAPILNRKCSKKYQLPGTNLTIDAGTSILIPSASIQRDSKYYPNPLKFEPNRFLAENTVDKSFVDMPYLPFADGPRNCIGMRLGKLQIKVGLLMILNKFTFILAQPNEELAFSAKTILLAPVSGINLRVTRR